MIFVGYMGQVIDVDITKARLTGLESADRSFVHSATDDQPGQPLALEQPMDARARDCRIDKLAGDGTEVAEGQIKRALEFAKNRTPLGLAERGAQPMSDVRAKSVELSWARQRQTMV